MPRIRWFSNAPVASSTRPDRTAPLRRLTVAGALLLGLLVAAPSAQATAPFWSVGSTGYSDTGTGHCKRFDVSGRLDVWAAAPEVFGRNFTAGGGNDWQWVRYRSYLVKESTNVTLNSSTWSDWYQAWDTLKAPFAYRPQFTNVSSGTVIEVRVEWWNSTQMLGAAAHRISPYTYHNGMQGPFGPFGSCGFVY